MNIIQEFDTIAAIATPLGMGGVAVVRISGEKTYDIISKIFKKSLKTGQIAHGWIEDDNVKIDEVVILPFKKPNSYTGEDVVEIQCHGGINVVRNILELVLKSGARMAERGEYTKRAFLNGKMDLSQAEAVADLIHAKTQNFAVQSAKNLSGILAKKTYEIKNGIFEILSRITAGIDFPDEIEEPTYDWLKEKVENSLSEIDDILRFAKSSDILRQGVKIAIVGCPNVGKSSLFNALLNMDRAIVTDIAGTTRDVIRETLDFDGIPVTLIDTAGIHDKTSDKVEEIGIEYSKQSLEDADLILFLYDISIGKTKDDEKIFEIVKDKNYIEVANKIDLAKNDVKCCGISTLTGDGIENLKSLILERIGNVQDENLEFTTNSRQENCLKNAKNFLENVESAIEEEQLQDLISIDVKSALLALEEITGEVITDDILNNIFEHFCVGK